MDRIDTGAVSRREILRYLGYKNQEADAAVSSLVESCVEELGRVCEPRSLVREFPLTLGEDGEIDFGCFQTRSRNLTRNLRDCESALLFAATIGVGADNLIRRSERLEMSRAVVFQAASAAMIEEYCDEVCTRLRREYEERGFYLRPRFSPGYGDFPLSCQTQLLGALEAAKRAGITLTDSLLMMPSKSVSAVMGISRKPYRCDVKGCEACAKIDCAYRR